MGFFDTLNDQARERSALFNSGNPKGDASDEYANSKKLYIEFYHLPSDKSVAFKAYVKDWTDKFNSSYNSEEVYGRNDKIHTFSGTDREISLSWDAPAASAQEARENLARVSLLAKFLYPGFKMENLNYGLEATSGNSGSRVGSTVGASEQTVKVGTMTKAPLIKVRFANLILDSSGAEIADVDAKNSGLLVAMDGLTISTDFDEGVIDSTVGIAYPKVLQLSTTLRVIHQHSLGWDNDTKLWLGNSEGALGFPYNAEAFGSSDDEDDNQAAPPADPAAAPGSSGNP